MKTLLITGASSGLGQATAETFADRGWNVVATMRDPEGGTGAGADLAARENVLVTRLDVSDGASVRAAIEAGIARFGAIDALINNAGFSLFGTFEELYAARGREMFETNVFGLMDVTLAVLPHFRARRSGLIVNVGSMAGRFAFPLGTLYDATKHALEGFSEALAYEVLPLGIGVKIIEPGLVRTRMTGAIASDVPPDDAIPDYASFTEHTLAMFRSMMAGDVPDAATVAGRIFDATTDGTDRLRYAVTEGGPEMEATRRTMTDEAHVAGMRAMFVPPVALPVPA
ncbi:SDR family oxidoreductase [bacterium]|nr:MAG: SDR family oxidoreductase [bacterium]